MRFIGNIKLWACSLSIGGALVLSAAAPSAMAQSREEVEQRCQHRIQHAEHELHEAIEHHGRDSRQAEHGRRELHEARQQCWRENHRWWDEREQRWHDQRDWNDHDRD